MALLLEGRGANATLIRAVIGMLHTGMLSEPIAKREGGITLVAEEISLLTMDAAYVFVEISTLDWVFRDGLVRKILGHTMGAGD